MSCPLQPHGLSDPPAPRECGSGMKLPVVPVSLLTAAHWGQSLLPHKYVSHTEEGRQRWVLVFLPATQSQPLMALSCIPVALDLTSPEAYFPSQFSGRQLCCSVVLCRLVREGGTRGASLSSNHDKCVNRLNPLSWTRTAQFKDIGRGWTSKHGISSYHFYPKRSSWVNFMGVGRPQSQTNFNAILNQK